jgi:hypothetical protein
MTTFKAGWDWSDIDQSSLLRHVGNHGVRCERNSVADSPSASLLTLLELHRGVPVPGEACDGAFINHPDADLADPAPNTSGVPWHTLYYNENYRACSRSRHGGTRGMCSGTRCRFASVAEGD